MDNSDLIFESIFKRKLSDPDTKGFLMQLAKDHPYFIPAHFFLLQQTDKDTATYKKLFTRTAILFNNPYWLNFQLQINKQQHNGSGGPHLTNEIAAHQNYPIVFSTDLPETIVPNSSRDVTENVSFATVPLVEQTPMLKEGFSIDKANTLTIESEQVSEPVEKNVAEPVYQKEHFTQTNEPLTELSEMAAAPELTIYPTHFNNGDIPLVNEPETEEDDLAKEEVQPLHFKLNIHNSPETDTKLSFEPLHTSDYFASLGIKLSGDILPTDKLGKQLKSFTEWLKTMKKIHPGQPSQQNEHAETSVQLLAEKSNMEGEILTESMAEVLLQQGKIKKAIEVFKKLSLLDTSKSAYFAAKIDQLKEL